MKLAVFTAGVYAHTSVFLCTVAAKAGEIFALFVNAVQKDIRRISYCTELFGNSVLVIYDRQYLVGRAEYGVAYYQLFLIRAELGKGDAFDLRSCRRKLIGRLPVSVFVLVKKADTQVSYRRIILCRLFRRIRLVLLIKDYRLVGRFIVYVAYNKRTAVRACMRLTQINPARTCGQGVVYFCLFVCKSGRCQQIT